MSWTWRRKLTEYCFRWATSTIRENSVKAEAVKSKYCSRHVMSLSGCADSREGKDAFERSLREGNARDGEGGNPKIGLKGQGRKHGLEIIGTPVYERF